MVVADAAHALSSENVVLVQHFILLVDDANIALYAYIQVFPTLVFPVRDTMLYYSGRGKEDYTINHWYTDELCTETESVLTTETPEDIEVDYYLDVLTKPIFLYFHTRDYTLTMER